MRCAGFSTDAADRAYVIGLRRIAQVTMSLRAAKNLRVLEQMASPSVLNISQVSGSSEYPGPFIVKRAADRGTDVFHVGSMLLHEGHRK